MNKNKMSLNQFPASRLPEPCRPPAGNLPKTCQNLPKTCPAPATGLPLPTAERGLVPPMRRSAEFGMASARDQTRRALKTAENSEAGSDRVYGD